MQKSWLFLTVWWVTLSGSLAQAQTGAGGLDTAEAIGKYLNGALPSETPRPATGSYRLVNAFPSLTFIDPVQMLPVPLSNRLLVVEKAGRLVVFDNESTASSKTVLIDIRSKVESSHDSGMMGAAFHPEFGQAGSPNRYYLYIFYRYTPQKSETNKAYIRLSRFTWNPTTATISQGSEFVLINQYDRHNWHNGGGIFFGLDGYLYVSVGDEGGANDQYNDGQRRDLGLLAGVLRIDVDQDLSRGHAIRRQPRNPATPPAGWPGSYSQGYTIPNDNPWPSANGSQLEEFYAIGLRSPHRMTQDPVTGRIWLGDVGQGTREEVSNVVKGANLQWPYREGSVAGPKAKPSPLLGVDQPPLYDYGRSTGTCVIGGYVYRGSLHPELRGKYLFGDHGSSRIWSLEERAGGGVQVNTLLTLSRHGPGPKNGMSAFGIDAAGEIYVMSLAGTDLDGGLIYRLDKSTTGVPEPPMLLSQTTAFTDLDTLTPSPGVMPYDVIQPLWSDGAEKRRWIAIPNDGNPNTAAEKIGWSETGHWSFPRGTVMIKHFEIPGRRLETRFMLRGEDDEWFGFTYKWRPDGSDADLLPGSAVEETFTVAGREWTWHFPGRNECSTCHTDAANHVLGVKARHLNSVITYPRTGRDANQLVTLNRLGFFSPAINEASLPNILTANNIADSSATLERRARSYLDINCSQCHQPSAPTQAVFDARLETPPYFQNLINVVPNNPLGVVGARLVKPGQVDLSIAHKRVGSLTEGEKMPPLAKNVVHSEGLALLAEWITSLDPATTPTGLVGGTAPVDHTPPTLALSIRGGGPVVGGPFLVDVVASEPIIGLATSDFTVNGGRVTSVSGSGAAWTVAVAPSRLGAGSVSLASDRFTDVNGNANTALASPLGWDLRVPVDPDDLLTDGEFENGLANWDRGGEVTVSDTAHGGAKAARLGASSFVVQSFAITAGQNFRYTGRYFTQGTPTSLEAGLSFWGANGQWVADRVVTLEPSSAGYSPFELEFTVPAGATSVSVWVLTGTGGGATVDGLSLKAGGDGDPVENLLGNGDFEAGLAQWDSGNDVTVSTSANDGTKAARLGALSFIVQTKVAAPGESFTLDGAYFTSGNSERVEVGFSFWRASGEWIEDRTIVLGNTTSYADFVVNATAPAGSVSMTIWVWCGAGGTVTVDGLRLLRGETDGPDNLLANGDFESGDLGGWDSGGSASLTNEARTGVAAGQLGADSFLVHNQAATPGENYTLGGHYLTTAGNVHEAGFSFWGPSGEWLGDSYQALDSAAAYTAFEVAGVVPVGATSFSAWFWSGAGSAMRLDDLSLLRDIEDPGITQDSGAGDTVAVARSAGLDTGEAQMLASERIRGASTGSGGGAGSGLVSAFGDDSATLVEDLVPDPSTAGEYGGLVMTEAEGNAGNFLLSGGASGWQVTASGRFSGRMQVNGRSLVVRGAFDANGRFETTYRDGRTLSLGLISIQAPGPRLAIWGDYIDGDGDSHRLRLSRAMAYSKRQPTPRSGAHTLLLPGARDTDAMGHAVVRITDSGRVFTLGRLAEGQRLSHAGRLHAGDGWTIHRLLGRRPEVAQIGGELRFLERSSPMADFGGRLRRVIGESWVDIDAIGSRYRSPARGVRALSGVEATDGAAIAELSDADEGRTDFWPIEWLPNQRLGSTGARRLIGLVNPRTGLLRGRVIDARNGHQATVEGVVFPRQDLVGGATRAADGGVGALIIRAGSW